jgi:hypothetical protein
MIIVDTPFHITFSSLCDLPIYACIDKCKKVFWESNMKEEANKEKCSMCDGILTKAVDGVHFKILSKANRNLKLSDIKAYNVINNSEKKALQSYLAMDAQIMHLSYVKPQFEKRAIAEWMPNGLSVKSTIKYD